MNSETCERCGAPATRSLFERKGKPEEGAIDVEHSLCDSCFERAQTAKRDFESPLATPEDRAALRATLRDAVDEAIGKVVGELPNRSIEISSFQYGPMTILITMAEPRTWKKP